jgi:hypothetical protein
MDLVGRYTFHVHALVFFKLEIKEIMEKYNLFLDDFRHPYDCVAYMPNKAIYAKLKWEIVRSYDEFVDYITKHGLPAIISYDHDLADEHYDGDMYDGVEAYNKKYAEFKEKTGLDCAKWVVDYCMDNEKDLPEYVVHSMNPAGGKNIWEYLENYRKFQENERN